MQLESEKNPHLMAFVEFFRRDFDMCACMCERHGIEQQDDRKMRMFSGIAAITHLSLYLPQHISALADAKQIQRESKQNTM